MEIIGLTEENIKKISEAKKERSEVLDFRLNSFRNFQKLSLPSFGPELQLDFSKIIYYKSSEDTLRNNWNQVLKPIVNELDDLGVMESERHMGGMGVQYESEVIYHNMLEELKNKKVIFTSIEDAMIHHKDIVSKYFGKIVSNDENKFAALNGSVFSGGSFIYVPPHTK